MTQATIAPHQISQPGLPPSYDYNQLIREGIEAGAQARFNEFMAEHKRNEHRAVVLDSHEVADKYGMTLKQVQRLTRSGTLPGSKPDGGGRYVYIMGGVEDAIEALRRPDGSLRRLWRPEARARNRHNKKAA